MSSIARRIHIVSAWLLVVGVLVQGYLAGTAMTQLGGTGDFALHRDLGYSLMGLLALLVLIFSILGRLPRRQIGLNALLLVLYVVQTFLPLARDSSPAIAALHPVNAMVMVVLAVVVAVRAKRHLALGLLAHQT